jgi:hypothetical protein
LRHKQFCDITCPSSTKLDGVLWFVNTVFIIVVTCCVGMYIAVHVSYMEGAYFYVFYIFIIYVLEICDSLRCMYKAAGYFILVFVIYMWLVGMQGSWISWHILNTEGGPISKMLTITATDQQ